MNRAALDDINWILSPSPEVADKHGLVAGLRGVSTTVG